MKSPKVFLGAEPNLKALLTRLANLDDKLVASFSQLIGRLALKPKEDASYEIAQVNLNYYFSSKLFGRFDSNYLVVFIIVMSNNASGDSKSPASRL